MVQLHSNVAAGETEVQLQIGQTCKQQIFGLYTSCYLGLIRSYIYIFTTKKYQSHDILRVVNQIDHDDFMLEFQRLPCYNATIFEGN